MKRIVTLFFTCFCISINLFSQNVGINNTNPDRPLSIVATGTNNDLISLRDTNNITLWHINYLGNGLNFARTGLQDGRLFLSHDGFVGIGTINPSHPLHLRSSYSGQLAHFSTTGSTAQIGISNNNNRFGVIGVSNGGMHVGTENTVFFQDLRLMTGGIHRVIIKDSSGNVGINAGNPQNTLDVGGNMVIGTGYASTNTAPVNSLLVEGYVGIGATNPLARLHVHNPNGGTIAQFNSATGLGTLNISNNTGTAQIAMSASSMYVGSPDNVDFRIRTNGTDRVFVMPGTGNVGIGVSVPANKLDVEGAMVIGSAYSGSFPAPVNGLLVEGNVGIQTTSAGTSLTVAGGVSISSQTINVSGVTATVNAGNRSYLRINNTGNLATLVTMADGLSDGQILVVVAQSSGGGAVQFTDAAANNTQLNSNYAMGIDDTLTLIWDVTLSKWIELHRSVN